MQRYDYLIVGAELFGSVFAYKATHWSSTADRIWEETYIVSTGRQDCIYRCHR